MSLIPSWEYRFFIFVSHVLHKEVLAEQAIFGQRLHTVYTIAFSERS